MPKKLQKWSSRYWAGQRYKKSAIHHSDVEETGPSRDFVNIWATPVHMSDPHLASPYYQFLKATAEAVTEHKSAIHEMTREQLAQRYEKYFNTPSHEWQASFFKDTDGKVQMREVSEVAPQYDWEGLRKKIIEDGGIRNASVMAYAPQHEPIRMLRPYYDTIEIIRDPDYFRRKTGKLKGEISDNQGQEETSEPTGGTQAQEDDDVGRSPAD